MAARVHAARGSSVLGHPTEPTSTTAAESAGSMVSALSLHFRCGMDRVAVAGKDSPLGAARAVERRSHPVQPTDGGQSWIRTSVGVSQQIYSLPPLATRASTHAPSLTRYRRGAMYGGQAGCLTRGKSSARSPKPGFPRDQSERAHRQVRHCVHDDAAAEVFRPYAERIREAAINKGTGVIDRVVGEHEGTGHDRP